MRASQPKAFFPPEVSDALASAMDLEDFVAEFAVALKAFRAAAPTPSFTSAVSGTRVRARCCSSRLAPATRWPSGLTRQHRFIVEAERRCDHRVDADDFERCARIERAPGKHHQPRPTRSCVCRRRAAAMGRAVGWPRHASGWAAAGSPASTGSTSERVQRVQLERDVAEHRHPVGEPLRFPGVIGPREGLRRRCHAMGCRSCR